MLDVKVEALGELLIIYLVCCIACPLLSSHRSEISAARDVAMYLIAFVEWGPVSRSEFSKRSRAQAPRGIAPLDAGQSSGSWIMLTNIEW